MADKINLKQRRIELGLTMKDVANAVGVSESTVSRWEAGNIVNMKRNRLVALANILQIPVNKLIISEESTVVSDPEFHMLQRTYEKMSPKDRQKMMNVLKATFDEYFNDDNNEHTK